MCLLFRLYVQVLALRPLECDLSQMGSLQRLARENEAIRVGLKQATVLVKTGNLQTDPHTGERHVKREVAICKSERGSMEQIRPSQPSEETKLATSSVWMSTASQNQ